LLHEELHWLDVPEHIYYKLGVTVHRCLQYKALEYLVDCCTAVSEIKGKKANGKNGNRKLGNRKKRPQKSVSIEGVSLILTVTPV